MRGSTFLAILIAFAPAAANAADDSICADRPGKSSETCTVPAGHWQIETSVADWSVQKGGGERDTSLTLGETTIKYGVTNRLDVEVDVTPWQRATNRSGNVRDSVSGVGDVLAEFKYQMTVPGTAFQVSAYPYVKIPTARRALGNGRWEGGLLVPIAYSIPKSQFSIGLTPEADLVADSDGHGYHAAMVQVANIGWQANDKLNLSAEIWGQWDWDPARTGKQVSVDGSVAYLMSNDVQLDAGANFGLNRQTPDIELYSGISVRF